jgi:hypothetical protein
MATHLIDAARLNDLSHSFDADSFDDPLFDQVLPQALKGPFRKTETQHSRVRHGDTRHLSPLLFCKKWWATGRFAAPQSFKAFIVEAMNPFADVDGMEFHRLADLWNPLAFGRESNDLQAIYRQICFISFH